MTAAAVMLASGWLAFAAAEPAPDSDSDTETETETETDAETTAERSSAARVPIGVRWKLAGELGALGVGFHRLQLSENGTNFDLRRDGRQDTLFLFGRVSTELELDDHHEIVLLYQPLRLRTETTLTDPLVADGTTFAPGTGVDVFYGFDFYRVSYLYDFFTDLDDEVAIGASLQFRNFRSSYVSKDGTQSVVNTNFGPVPAIKFRGRHALDTVNFWYGTEIDGFYANLPFINGGDDPVEGLIVDASVRAGFTTWRQRLKPYVNLRYLGGGAKGTDSDSSGPGDGFTRNWLHTFAASVGVEMTFGVVDRDREARDRQVAARKARRRRR